MTTALYVPGTSEKDMSKVIMSAQLVAGQTATNTDAITTNTSAITALQAGPLVSGAVAAKSDQTTATSTTLAVTPGRQQFHPSAAKAWVTLTGSTAAILASYNITSVSRTSAGVYVITFTTAFTTANYVSVQTSEVPSGTVGIVGSVVSKTASAATVQTFNLSGAAGDPTSLHVAFFGTE